MPSSVLTASSTTTTTHQPVNASVRRATTIKQARAEFKARGAPVISEHEQRQLDRAALLDHRAYKIREADKKRGDLEKKRVAKERDEKLRAQQLLGSQRRTDRFGHVSSQFHLGAFFGGASNKKEMEQVKQQTARPAESRTHEVVQKQNDEEKAYTRNDDGFGDDELSDDVLLDALEIRATPCAKQDQSSSVVSDKLTSFEDEDLDAIWADLESSTQVARDLSSSASSKSQTSSASFSSSDWDISLEEIEVLETMQTRTDAKVESAVRDSRMMPPPPPPPAIPGKSIQSAAVSTRNLSKSNTAPATTHVFSVGKTVQDCGYSIAELESYVDDDLQLTQIAPG